MWPSFADNELVLPTPRRPYDHCTPTNPDHRRGTAATSGDKPSRHQLAQRLSSPAMPAHQHRGSENGDAAQWQIVQQ
ncbi:hypothetical protein [Chloroflexus aggregans]|uniref:hypothetical protein n=1 Tax=Chloroflexus aggregans TaxID=152260 RepID=UPI0012ECD8B3|nr:hypothetical protein [Chloroflexus aggregans]